MRLRPIPTARPRQCPPPANGRGRQQRIALSAGSMARAARRRALRLPRRWLSPDWPDIGRLRCPDGADLLLTDVAPPPGPWWRAALVLIFLTLAGQAMAGGGDDMIRHRGGGQRSTRPPITRQISTRAATRTSQTGRTQR